MGQRQKFAKMAPKGELPDEPHKLFDTILTLDFGSQYTHLITRRLRELNVYSEMLPCTQKLADLSWKPKGIILSGGPYSVYEADAPHVDPAIFELGVPILGICYGLQEIAWHHGKNVIAGTEREYGHADVKANREGGRVDKLFKDLEDDVKVWMSHGDKLGALPPQFHIIATTKNSPYAGIAHETKPIYGIQFHPEVTHTPRGTKLLENFAVGICGAKQTWTMATFVDKEIARIRALVGEKGQVLGAVSGGVDSTVAAKLMHEAIGDRFHAVLVDNGCMRLNECEQVKKTLTEHLGINLTVVDASDLFLDGLKGIHDNPEAKRKFIGGTFIDVFEAEALKIEEAAKNSLSRCHRIHLLQRPFPDYQNPPQRRRSSRAHDERPRPQAHRTPSRTLQRRSTRTRKTTQHPSRPRHAPSLPRTGNCHPSPRRGDP